MALRYEFVSTTNQKLARDLLEDAHYTLTEDPDGITVHADDNAEQDIEDLIHRFGAFKIEDYDPDQDDDEALERERKDRARREEANGTSPR